MIRAVMFLFFASSVIWAQEVFRYSVELEKLPRSEKGHLIIDSTGVAYNSENGKRSIQIALLDIHEADVSDPREIRIETYDMLKRKLMGRRRYEFRLREVEHGPELARFLSAHLKRPIVGYQDLAAQGEAAQEIPAYHRHRFGGCNGTLRIDSRGIQFVSDKVADSRSWLHTQIETIGAMNGFHFRVSTVNETYNFDLKETLPDAAYDLSFRVVNRIESREEPK